jgi:hypothetical protein
MQINSVVSPGGMSGVPSQNRDEPQNAKMYQPQLRRYWHRKLKRRPAVRATIASGKANARILGTACIIAPENLASLRGAGKYGYREFQITTYKGQPTMMVVREPSPSR